MKILKSKRRHRQVVGTQTYKRVWGKYLSARILYFSLTRNQTAVVRLHVTRLGEYLLTTCSLSPTEIVSWFNAPPNSHRSSSQREFHLTLAEIFEEMFLKVSLIRFPTILFYPLTKLGNNSPAWQACSEEQTGLVHDAH